MVFVYISQALTYEKAEQLRKQLAERTAELERLEATEPSQIWLTDLENIEIALADRDKEIEMAAENEVKAQKKTAKRQASKAKKAAAAKKRGKKKKDEWVSDDEDSDDSDDFVPTKKKKPAARAKKAPPTQKPKPVAKKVSKPAALTVMKEPDDVEIIKTKPGGSSGNKKRPSPKAKKPVDAKRSKASTTKTAIPKEVESSEEEVPQSRCAVRRAIRSRKTPATTYEYSDEDSFMVESDDSFMCESDGDGDDSDF